MTMTISYVPTISNIHESMNDFDNTVTSSMPLGTQSRKLVVASRLLFMDQDFVIAEITHRVVRNRLFGKRVKISTKNISGNLSFDTEADARAVLNMVATD